MENEIIPGIDGLYAVCFNNNKAYDAEKVKEIFDRYGSVMSVRFSGQEERQMVFVRYKEYNEVKRCLDDVYKTSGLFIRMARSTKNMPQGVPYQQTRKYVTHLVRTAC
jgi:hypothetical protein